MGCRSRRKVPTPEAMPSTSPATTTTQTAESVPTSERHFVAPAAEQPDRDPAAATQLRSAFFGYDEATLSSDAQDALREAASWLRDHPEFSLRIEGHCDERGTEQYNLALGDRRAYAAKEYLTTLGINAGRIRTVSYGEERPKHDNAREETRRLNRRAALVVRLQR